MIISLPLGAVSYRMGLSPATKQTVSPVNTTAVNKFAYGFMVFAQYDLVCQFFQSVLLPRHFRRAASRSFRHP
jgi:hypothetical protein